MTWTTEAWLREALGALRRTLDVDARTKNEMVQFLLDEGFWDKEKLSTWESAIAKFNSCLNPSKSEFFKVGELWALSKRFGRHDLFLAMAADLGYEVRRLPTEERQQELLEQLAHLQAQHGEALERISAQLAQAADRVSRNRRAVLHLQQAPVRGGRWPRDGTARAFLYDRPQLGQALCRERERWRSSWQCERVGVG